MSNERRVKSLHVPNKAMLYLFCSGGTFGVTVRKGLPEDAFVRYAFMDNYTGSFVFMVESKAFDPVPEGQIPPELRLELNCFPNYVEVLENLLNAFPATMTMMGNQIDAYTEASRLLENMKDADGLNMPSHAENCPCEGCREKRRGTAA